MTMRRARLNIVTMIALSLLVLTFSTTTTKAQANSGLSDFVLDHYGAPPDIPTGPITKTMQQNVGIVFKETLAGVGSVSRSTWGDAQSEALAALVDADDPRVVWLISDLLRFIWRRETSAELSAAAGELLGIDLQTQDHWTEITDYLIAWDVPAFDGYLDAKRAIYTTAVHGWDGIFEEGDIDWRMVTWGGVPIDRRAYDTTDVPCSCIPAVDNPEVSRAEDATWLRDDDIVFGLTINGESRAYPRRIMEVREMVNDTLGGRDLGIPYCTLCGAAQAFFTDGMPLGVKRPILRTTGLLIRSNKVMYDVNTGSLFDTFLGKAVTGPLAEIGLELDQAAVITTDWGTWKATYPETTVLVEKLALGRDFDLRNTRDANGPIFPVGDVDPRLPVHEDIIGIVTASGRPVAFQRSAAFLALSADQEVVFEDVHLTLDAGGIRAVTADGQALGSHQAFWFAWSQFHPGTELWQG